MHDGHLDPRAELTRAALARERTLLGDGGRERGGVPRLSDLDQTGEPACARAYAAFAWVSRSASSWTFFFPTRFGSMPAGSSATTGERMYTPHDRQ